MISELHEERFNVNLTRLAQNRIPCGIFFGFNLVPKVAADVILSFQNVTLNISCAIVLADVQADVLKKFVNVPVITLEDFPRFGEENFPVKPQEVYIHEGIADPAFAPYFARHDIVAFSPLYVQQQDLYFALMMKNLPALYQ